MIGSIYIFCVPCIFVHRIPIKDSNYLMLLKVLMNDVHIVVKLDPMLVGIHLSLKMELSLHVD